jgi:hypothetical protein
MSARLRVLVVEGQLLHLVGGVEIGCPVLLECLQVLTAFRVVEDALILRGQTVELGAIGLDLRFDRTDRGRILLNDLRLDQRIVGERRQHDLRAVVEARRGTGLDAARLRVDMRQLHIGDTPHQQHDRQDDGKADQNPCPNRKVFHDMDSVRRGSPTRFTMGNLI